MKTTIIKLQNKFVLVSNEEINVNDNCYNIAHQVIVKPTDKKWANSNSDNLKKIIASVPELLLQLYDSQTSEKSYISKLPSINFSLLSEEDCKTIGYNHWSKHWEIVNRQTKEGVNPHAYRLGFKAAQSFNDKLFSLDDINKSFQAGSKHCATENKIYSRSDSFEQFIYSLQQKIWDVEIEMQNCKDCINLQSQHLSPNCCHNPIPKITNNSIKITKIL